MFKVINLKTNTDDTNSGTYPASVSHSNRRAEQHLEEAQMNTINAQNYGYIWRANDKCSAIANKHNAT